MTSHRSGETESVYIADLSIGLKTGYVILHIRSGLADNLVRSRLVLLVDPSEWPSTTSFSELSKFIFLNKKTRIDKSGSSSVTRLSSPVERVSPTVPPLLSSTLLRLTYVLQVLCRICQSENASIMLLVMYLHRAHRSFAGTTYADTPYEVIQIGCEI